jgi:hypothetical protein
MMRGHPPRAATWLLQRFAAGRHSESLEGDLIEQYAQGRSHLWYWRQVAMAILLAQSGAFRAGIWIATLRVFLHLFTELAVVLAAVSLITQSRRAHEWQDMLSPAFIGTMAVLITIASVGLWLTVKLLKWKRSHGPINLLIVFFAVVALGVGTLSWASATRRQCSAETCHCQSMNDNRPLQIHGR